jgi:hypothetical protein
MEQDHVIDAMVTGRKFEDNETWTGSEQQNMGQLWIDRDTTTW